MRFVGIMHNSKAITSGIGVLVRKDLVTNDIDISFDLGFLDIQKVSKSNISLTGSKLNLPTYLHSSRYTSVVP